MSCSSLYLGSGTPVREDKWACWAVSGSTLANRSLFSGLIRGMLGNSEWFLELLVRPFKENAFRVYLPALPPTVHFVEVMGWIRQPDPKILGEEAFILERSGDLRSSNHIPWDSKGHSLFNALTIHLAVWVYIACVLLACSALLTCLMRACANALCFWCSMKSQLEYMAIVPGKQHLEGWILVKIVLETQNLDC